MTEEIEENGYCAGIFAVFNICNTIHLFTKNDMIFVALLV
ncbi:hypothetical protein BSM4216_2661 [Bacillus smithii]|nr:hypothetical protein BSM4216_2661 [Bacillus smithii]